ncbi:MAG TPA: toxic anion resistance protein [Clostridiales bacterium]|nr:toxic anion resistance protein [Clostridiales bacterium]
MGFENLLENIEGDEKKSLIKEETNSLEVVEVVKEAEPAVPVGTKREVDLSKFSEEDRENINKMKDNMSLTSSNDVASIGTEAQSNIAKFADGLLEGVKTKDTGVVGDNLTTLLTTIKGVNLEGLNGNKSFISKIPFLRSISNSVVGAKIKLENVTETVDNIVVALDTARKELIRDINVLDVLYDKNLEYLHNLELCIAAGELKYNELSETVLVELKSKANQTQDMVDIQKYNDFAQMLSEVEKRIYDLKLSREIARQTMPQIRIIQGNDKILSNKIQTSVLTTIPIWKNQIALTISLNKQKTALELQKKVSDTTEDLLKQNANILKMNSIEIAKESERGVISIETLKETHTRLIETIEESMKIYSEGRQKRQMAEKELTQMEATQKQKLLELRGK